MKASLLDSEVEVSGDDGIKYSKIIVSKCGRALSIWFFKFISHDIQLILLNEILSPSNTTITRFTWSICIAATALEDFDSEILDDNVLRSDVV